MASEVELQQVLRVALTVYDEAGEYLHLQPLTAEARGFDGLTGDEVLDVLREAQHRGYVRVMDERRYMPNGFGGRLDLTPQGMRMIDAWPPGGREDLPGSWDDDHWGKVALPLLAALPAQQPHMAARANMGPGVINAVRERRAYQMLIEAGLAHDASGDLLEVMITEEGREALNPTMDHVKRARRMLAEGAIVDAIIEAVEKGLKGKLHELAALHDVALTKPGGAKKKHAEVNDQLCKAGAYDEWLRKNISAVLGNRNGFNHGETEDKELAALTIDMTEFVLDRLGDAADAAVVSEQAASSS